MSLVTEAELEKAQQPTAIMRARDVFREYTPPWYLRSGHIQTILTAFYRPKLQVPDPIVQLVDLGERGGTHIYRNEPVAADAAACESDQATVMLHGLGSCHSGSYMTGVCHGLLQRGWRTIRVDMPGAGPSYHTTDLPPHAGSSKYVLRLLDWISENWGIRRFQLVGFSLGGNISLHLASYFADQLRQRASDGKFQVERIFAMAPPLDLEYCCRSMERGVNRLYARYFLRGLRRAASLRADRWERWKTVQTGFQSKTLRRFDDRVTAPLAGYVDSTEYYRYSSVHERLHLLETPTTIVADRRDPIVPFSLFQNISHPCVNLVETDFGGHLGYYTHGFGRGLTRWADEAFAEMIANAARQD